MSLLLHPYPTGWYAVGLCAELATAEVKSFAFMGEQVVLFRTESGVATLMDALCRSGPAAFAQGVPEFPAPGFP